MQEIILVFRRDAAQNFMKTAEKDYSISDLHGEAITLQEESISNASGKKVKKNLTPFNPSKISLKNFALQKFLPEKMSFMTDQQRWLAAGYSRTAFPVSCWNYQMTFRYF